MPDKEIEAKKDAPSGFQVSGKAYTGIAMNVWAWSPPVVVDLSGLKASGKVPLLIDHRNEVDARLGQVSVETDGKTLSFQGQIVSESDQAKEIIRQMESKEPWQTSIGAKPVPGKSEEVTEGSREINGRNHKAPFIHIKAAKLNEISVVPVGADSNTKMVAASNCPFYLDVSEDPAFSDIRAKYQSSNYELDEKEEQLEASGEASEPIEEVHMPDEDVKTEDVKATSKTALLEAEKEKILSQEREAVKARNAENREICNGEFPDIEAKAIDECWEPDRTRKEVLKELRAKRPSPEFNISVPDKPEGDKLYKVLEAALCMKGNLSGDCLMQNHKFTEEIVSKAEDYMLSLGDLMVVVARAEGKTKLENFSGGRKDQIIRAAFSTISLPGILNNVANKQLLRGYNMVQSYADILTSPGNLSDFKEHEMYRMTDLGDLEPLAKDGSFVHGDMTEAKSVNQLDTYGKIFGLSRKNIINDNLGAFNRIPRAYGNKGRMKKDKLFFTALLANATFQGAALFSTTHLNYDDGTDSAISFAALQAMVQLFDDQVDADGDPIAVNPRFWVVPTKWRVTANEIAGSTTKTVSGGDSQAGVAAVTYPVANMFSEMGLTVLAPPWLSNSNFTNYSTEGHYLFGNPNEVDTFQMGYLDGKRTPTVEFADTDFSTLGMLFRVYFDLGCKPIDYRGMVFFKGEA